MNIQHLYSYVRRAIDDYHMIADGDRIAIGISGGKDSLTLLYALSGLQNFYPMKFDLTAISVDLGFNEFDLAPVQKLCEQLHVPYYIVKTEIGKIVFEERQEKSPCALCAKMRKGALNDFAIQQNCNKVAYAHHMDDIIETMFLSMFYEGQFYSFPPVTKLERSGLTVIRPLMYVTEADVTGFKNKYKLPLVTNPCPADGITRREYIKQLVQQINQDNPGVKKQIFHAIVNGNIKGWTQKL